MDITEWRKKIDAADAELLALLNRRVSFTLEIGKIKQKVAMPLYDPEREKDIFDRMCSLNEGPLTAKAVCRLFERIIDESRRAEREVMGGSADGPGTQKEGES